MAPVHHIIFPLSPGRVMRAAMALPVQDGRRRPGVMVIHEVFGLNDDIRRITARIAGLGYVSMCPDLYDRSGLRSLCILRTMLSLGTGKGPAWAALDAARHYLSNRGDVDPNRLAVIGFCMGGGFALLYAMRTPMRVAGNFYGKVPKKAADLDGICPVIGGFGERDRFFARQGRRLNTMLDELDVPHDVKIYERAGHAFMSAHSGPLATLGSMSPLKADYDPKASEDSWRRLAAFLHRHLG